MKDKSSIYVSIFNRKGGEGLYTKVINENNKKSYEDLFNELDEKEKAFIIYYKNTLNWLLFTNFNILGCTEGGRFIINLSEIIEVQLALHEEYEDRITDKEKFTRLKIKTKNKDCFILNVEEGKPYQGLYQVLHFIVSNR
ncbi:hypothetical protein J2810_002456 [Chryseobacterium rhizosphaerae]|uniref:hypothetical protein n=1 Tax=Chryseobacterium rhizosphaerae TaxID=395937 RepID=UPI00285F3924|nr:hypothetical protein [Chryseobacterium rhizosphaerae]MDR6546397.1 hypothetical protein [Chryseobacterium rhizosphaerae]